MDFKNLTKEDLLELRKSVVLIEDYSKHLNAEAGKDIFTFDFTGLFECFIDMHMDILGVKNYNLIGKPRDEEG